MQPNSVDPVFLLVYLTSFIIHRNLRSQLCLCTVYIHYIVQACSTTNSNSCVALSTTSSNSCRIFFKGISEHNKHFLYQGYFVH
ncbi:hypothetical protein AQUCO_07200005v1 [Aquilegia coerulea]|uniref:Uncharacterized protein n=1 Tax=Aquilegia coerulea TaxID=218851 RepID=A0A2G5C9X3_AQUCA|nr:hypothetical protein AQUCO_07200005v1 [Aquilegia coerulea]